MVPPLDVERPAPPFDRQGTSTARSVGVIVALTALGALVVVAGVHLDSRTTRGAREAYLGSTDHSTAREIVPVGAVPDGLEESSGVAVSRHQPGVLWTHNDSGDGPTLYAIDESGRILGRYDLTNAAAVDWEDLALGRCPSPTGDVPVHCLYVGDTGDNQRQREELVVYVVAEPEVTGDGTPRPVLAQQFRFAYPDEPHDTEGLAVTAHGDVVVVSKGRSGSIDFFRMTRSEVRRALATGARLTAVHMANSAIQPDAVIGRQVTGAAVSPDGSRLAVRTYYEIYLYALPSPVHGGPHRPSRAAADSGRLSHAEHEAWMRVTGPCFLGDAEPQGEAIDFLDDSTFITTSERARGRPGPILRVRC